MIIKYFCVISLTILLIYCIKKERQESACNGLTIKKQCDEQQSTYIIGTKTELNDTTEILFDRLISILSYHDKTAVWRRCYIIAVLLLLMIYIVLNSINNNLSIYQWIIILLLLWAVLYIVFTYINFHHFNILKQNGIEIMNKLKNNFNIKIPYT